MSGQKRVGYFYNSDIGNFVYTENHLMNPKRIAMTHSLIVGYGIYPNLDVYTTREATSAEIMQFHSSEYVEYLQNYVSSNKTEILKKIGGKVPEIDDPDKDDMFKKKRFKIGIEYDCPQFDGLYTFSQLSTGGSIDAANLIIHNQADIAINWGGGLHHAKKSEASGFCYVNDIVICILELLRVYKRVLYIDIDVHHGDGVEEAFYTTNRVMTVSFHEFGENFFPYKGSRKQKGEGIGKNYSVNVPLQAGMDDDTYRELFQSVINRVMDVFRPDVIVFQSGADSLANDKIGEFNLSIRGHGCCLKHMMRFNIPIVVLGGGGYTIQNVSRCWAYETGLLVGMDIDGKIPSGDPYMSSYDNEMLHLPTRSIENLNKPYGLNLILQDIFQQLKEIDPVPGVQFHLVPKMQFNNEKMVCKDEEDDGNEHAISVKSEDDSKEYAISEESEDEDEEVMSNDINEQNEIDFEDISSCQEQQQGESVQQSSEIKKKNSQLIDAISRKIVLHIKNKFPFAYEKK